MYGRYGVDDLGKGMMFFGLFLFLIGTLTRNSFLMLLTNILYIWLMYRMLSKNVVKRSIENRFYLDKTVRLRRGWKVFRNNMTDKQYHYYLCPKCSQIVRVPRNKGKIEIRCPKCGTTFEKKS